MTPVTTPAEARFRGTIKTIKKAEGYGFITHTATGIDHFFHRSTIAKEAEQAFDELEIDQAVEFIPSEGPKGPRAAAVWPL